MKLTKRILALLLTGTIVSSLLYIPALAAAEAPGISIEAHKLTTEERSEYNISDANVYGLFFSGTPGTNDSGTPLGMSQMSTVISYDNTVILPYDSFENEVTENLEYAFEVTGIYKIDRGDEENYTALPFASATNGNITTFEYGVMTLDLEGINQTVSQVMYVMFFKIAEDDENNLKKGSIRLARGEELDSVKASSAAVLNLTNDDGTSAGSYAFTEGSESNNLDAPSLVYPNSTVAQIETLTLSADPTEVTVDGTNDRTVNLSATATDTEGDPYSTTKVEYSIDGGTTTARLSGNTITIPGNSPAGTITVTASLDGKSDQETITVNRATSTAGEVTINGADTITVPPVSGNTKIGDAYTLTVDDQFGDRVNADDVEWSITDDGGLDDAISILNGQLSISNNVPAGGTSITIKAEVKSVTPMTMADDGTATKEIKLVRQTPVATTVEISGIDSDGYDVPVASAQSGVFVAPEATVKDQYGDVMEDASVTWSLSSQPDGIEFDSTTGMITITTAVKTSCDLKLTVTVDGTSVTTSADVKINRAESVATEIIILRDEVPLDGADTVVKPAGSEPKTCEYVAHVMDQFDMPMLDLSPTMTASADTTGVSFADNTLTVTNEAAKGTVVTITASYDSLKATVTVTITDVDVDWNAVDAAVSGKSLTYGQKNSELANLPAAGTASAAETELEGTFSYKDGDTVQNAGSPKVTVVFTVTTDGEYKGVQVEKTYDVTVNRKAITVTADDKTKTYGQANPTLTFTVPDGALVNGDEASVLTVRLTCTAIETTGVGTVEITGTGTADNYDVTVTPGKLTISPATVTITTTAPTQSIPANSVSNSVEGLKALLNPLATVNITGAGTAATTADITWADATEKFDDKGGTYTYVGTVDENANFANRPTLTATVTVTPVRVIAISGGESITVSKSQVAGADSLAALGVDDSVTLTYDQTVDEDDKTVTADWDQTIAQVKDVANTVTETSGDKTVTLTLKDASIPAWATVQADLPRVTITITNKFPVTVTVTAPVDITYGEELSNPSASQTDAGNGTDDAGKYTYSYEGINGTTYGPSEKKPTAAGQYRVTATLVSDTHAGSGTSAPFKINPKDISGATVALPEDFTATYTGSAFEPAVTVTDGTTTLVAGTDYTVAYSNNTNVGQATVTVTGQGNYQGTVSGKFTISRKSLADTDITISGLPESVTYTGKAIEPQFTVTFGDIALVKGTDYTVTYSDNENAGTATVKISGQGNYTGERTATFTIAPAAAAGTVTISGNNYEVGTELTAEVSGDKHGTLAYQWYVNGAAVADATGDTFEIPADATSVYVVATSSGNYVGTLTSSAIEVGKKPLPTDEISIVVSVEIGEGEQPEPGTTVTATVNTGEIEVTLTIEWLRDGQVFRSGAADDPTFLTYTLTEADKGHTITARLVPGEGYTGEIVADQGVSVAATVPGKPAVTATAGDRTATIRWTVDDGGSPITQYKIQLGENTIYVDGGTTSYIFSGLSNGDTYKITVTAINAMGESAATEVTVMPKAPTPVDPGDDDDDDHHSSGGSSSSVTRYTITVEQNRGGEITPDTVRVRRGEDQTFRIRADEGYEIEDVLVDGESVGDVSRYTFENVRKAHTIEAIFRAIDEEEPGQSDRPFTDVDPNGWAAEYIYYLYDRGVVNGISTNQFAPTRSITRAEFVKMLAGVAGVADDELNYNSSSFTDVEPGSWYEPYVNWAVENGVTTGTSATTFSPTANITREQMAVMIYRFAQNYGVELPSGTSATFSDAASFSSWASEAIYAMQRAGIIDGVGGGRFAPADNATREQACKMLAVLMELM